MQIERKCMRKIYWCLLIIICADPYLAPFIPTTPIRAIEFLAFIILVISEVQLYHNRSLVLPAKGHTAVIVLFLLAIEIIIRGDWGGGIKAVMLHILHPSAFLSFLLPILIIPLPNTRYIKDIVHIFTIGALLSIPLWLIYSGQLVQEGFHGEIIGQYLPLFAAFLIGFQPEMKKYKKILVAIWAVYLILMLLNARRNMVFTLGVYGLLAYYCTYFKNIRKRNNSGHTIMAIFISVFVTLFCILNIDYMSNSVFKNFSTRLHQDTRSGVEEWFIADFMSAPLEDWIFGRGANGGYYQEMRNSETGEIETDRQGIETGYLQMILKGGVFYAITIIWIILTAFAKTIKIKNIYSVFLRGVFLLYLVDLYATTLMCVFGVKAVIFWFTISIVLSREYQLLGKTGVNTCRNETIYT